MLETKIVAIYQEFRRVLVNKNYRLDINERNLSIIKRFVELIEKNEGVENVGYDFLLDYTLYHFWWWSDKKSGAFFSNIPLIHQCYGKTPYERWRKRGKGWKFVATSKFKSVKGIDFDAIKAKLQEGTLSLERETGFSNLLISDFVNINPIEELEKQRFHNKKMGFIHCSIHTTLYNPKSLWCIRCKRNRADCRTLLKEQYRRIFDERTKS